MYISTPSSCSSCIALWWEKLRCFACFERQNYQLCEVNIFIGIVKVPVLSITIALTLRIRLSRCVLNQHFPRRFTYSTIKAVGVAEPHCAWTGNNNTAIADKMAWEATFHRESTIRSKATDTPITTGTKIKATLSLFSVQVPYCFVPSWTIWMMCANAVFSPHLKSSHA